MVVISAYPLRFLTPDQSINQKIPPLILKGKTLSDLCPQFLITFIWFISPVRQEHALAFQSKLTSLTLFVMPGITFAEDYFHILPKHTYLHSQIDLSLRLDDWQTDNWKVTVCFVISVPITTNYMYCLKIFTIIFNVLLQYP